jgi:hypothetical protein
MYVSFVSQRAYWTALTLSNSPRTPSFRITYKLLSIITVFGQKLRRKRPGRSRPGERLEMPKEEIKVEKEKRSRRRKRKMQWKRGKMRRGKKQEK